MATEFKILATTALWLSFQIKLCDNVSITDKQLSIRDLGEESLFRESIFIIRNSRKHRPLSKINDNKKWNSDLADEVP